MKRIYWNLRIFFLALRWIPRFNLGDEVIYSGERWTLIQGACAPRWDLVRGNARDGTLRRVDLVHCSEFRKVREIRNYWRSFKSGWRFYVRSWRGIWERSGIQPWMRRCNIWARG